jgi:hypothetical protein
MILILTVRQEKFLHPIKRISVFKGMATQANDDLANVYYPNPVRPGYVGTIKLLV